MQGLALPLAPRRPTTAPSSLGGDGGQSLSLAHGHDVPATAPKFDNNADSHINSLRSPPLGSRSSPTAPGTPAAGGSLYAAGNWVSTGPFASRTPGNLSPLVGDTGRRGGSGGNRYTLAPLGGGRSATATRTAAGSSLTLSGATTSAPPFDPTARNGNAPSANFTASVKRDQALAPANAALQQQRNDIMAQADAAAPPTATGTTQTLTGTRPDGTTFTRTLPQYAESQAVKDARRTALGLSLSPDATAAGQQAFDASVADAKTAYDAAHLPPLDPKALVANALAGKYTKEGDAAATRANNDTTVTQARADYLKQQRERLATLTPVEKERLQQQVQTLVSQGKLAEAHALLTGEQIQTEQQTRPGKVRGQQIRNQATQDANDRANQNQPVTTFHTLAEAYKTTHDSFGNPLPGAPAAPATNAQPPAPGGGLALQPARPATTQPAEAAAVPTTLPPLAPPPPPPQPAGTMQPLPPAPTLPATRPAAPAPAVAQQQQQATTQPAQAAAPMPRLKVPAGGSDNGDGTMSIAGGRYAPANINGQWHWKRVG